MSFFQKHCRVIAYDARGHGSSAAPDRPEDYSQELMVEDMRGVVDVLGISRAIVGGHSMGANVALNFALKYPERCIALIPVGIGTGSTNAEWWGGYWKQLADLVEQRGMAAMLEEMKKLPAWGSAINHPQVGEAISKTVLANSPQAIARTIRGIQMKRPGIFQLEPQLKKLSLPTLVVLSEGDTPVVECSRFLAQSVPNAILSVIPARSHWTHLEAPEQFYQAVDRFLSQHGT